MLIITSPRFSGKAGPAAKRDVIANYIVSGCCDFICLRRSATRPATPPTNNKMLAGSGTAAKLPPPLVATQSNSP